MLSWLSEGVRVEWNERGPPPPFHHGVASFTPAERAWPTLERDRCLATGGWRRATQTTHVSRAFVTYHKGKPRLVIDLRFVNLHTLARTCRFESMATLRRMIRRGDWMFSIDLTDAYHHVPFSEESVRYFTFGVETLDSSGAVQVEYFSTPVLNFGWTNSPAVFTEVLRAVVAHVRCPEATSAARRYGHTRSTRSSPTGTRTLPWLDDLLFLVRSAATHGEACARRDGIYSLLESLGLMRAAGKGQHDPTHFLEDHLGYGIDSERGLFLLTRRREAALAHGAHALMRARAQRQSWVATRQLASFCGLGEASGLALPLGRFMLRELYDCLATRRGWGGRVQLSSRALADLRWWSELRGTPHVGRAIWRPPATRELWTDASTLGWGGSVQRRLRRPPAAGFWSPDELPWHITRKELVAVRLSVQHFLPQLAGHRVLLHEDNMAVVWILTHFMSRSPELMHELRRLWYLLDAYDISLRAVYIRSAENRIADAASRLACSRDYVIVRALFEMLMARWGWCTVDAFASAATAQLPRYWAAHAEALGEATDALAQDWRGECLWVHPPPALLPAVAQMLEESGAEAYVCAPRWPAAAWYGVLHELSTEVIELPPGSLRAVAGDAPPQLSSWPLSVFRVPPRSMA